MFKTVTVSPKYQLLGYSTNISVQVCSCENRPNVMFLSTVLSFFFFFFKFPFGLRTCDHGPTFHWVGQACRLQGLRVSGRSSWQCLLWMARVVLSSDGWTQLTERICIPVFPHGLLQFCHSPVTQLEKHRGRERNRSSEGIQNVKLLK